MFTCDVTLLPSLMTPIVWTSIASCFCQHILTQFRSSIPKRIDNVTRIKKLDREEFCKHWKGKVRMAYSALLNVYHRIFLILIFYKYVSQSQILRYAIIKNCDVFLRIYGHSTSSQFIQKVRFFHKTKNTKFEHVSKNA